MYFLKKLSLLTVALVFCLGLLVTSSFAQSNRGGRSMQHRNDNWGHQQWRNGVRRNSNYRSGRISPQEARRLQRERMRLLQTRSRYYRNDGYLSAGERRRLARKHRDYRSDVRRDRQDW